MSCEDFDRLKILYRRTCALPQLSGTALRLIQTIDSGDASAIDLERIIVSDPGLAVGFLRAAAAANQHECERVTTVRQAIIFMGQRAVRSLAMSLALQGLLTCSDQAVPFDRIRFSRHSIFVGFLSRYLYARRNLREPFLSRWSADEVFAAGVLHDLGLGLLPRLGSDVYTRIHNYGRRAGLSLNQAFEKIYGESVGELSCSAAETWGLPEIFPLTLRYAAKPWQCAEEFTAICCISYADYLADQHDFGIHDWAVKTDPMPEVELEVGLPDQELPTVIELVARHTDAHVPALQQAA